MSEIQHSRGERVYHGSSISGLTRLSRASLVTSLGPGLYSSRRPGPAISYAFKRTEERGGGPIIYELQVQARLLDLTDPRILQRTMEGFGDYLEGLVLDGEDGLRASLEAINTGSHADGYAEEVLSDAYAAWQRFVKGLGYDGMVAFDRGEPWRVRKHVSVVLHDPNLASKVWEVKLGRLRVLGQGTTRPERQLL